MAKTVKTLALFAFVAAVAACTKPPQEEYVAVEPVSTEPVYTSKY
ncbi:hypothetical protein [Pontibaca salina]|nr:hypothetical protein [Pontibaca salina]